MVDKIYAAAFAERNNLSALQLLRWFLVGYQIESSLFLDHVETIERLASAAQTSGQPTLSVELLHIA